MFGRSKYTARERGLQATQKAMLMQTGMVDREAEELATEMLDGCIEDAKGAGTYPGRTDLGDLILGYRESPTPELAEWIEAKRHELSKLKVEAVVDDDIRTWWNLSVVERLFAIAQDNHVHMAMILNEIAEGEAYGPDTKSVVAMAMVPVRNTFPMYGDPEDTRNTQGEDRPLPYELKDRVNRWIERRVNNDMGQYKRDMESSTTFNALVRRAIRDKQL